jgi:hypothetical protein
MVEPVTKYAVTVMRPEDVRFELEKCLYLARSGRPGPVWLDIPMNVQSALVDENSLVAYEQEDNLVFDFTFHDGFCCHNLKTYHSNFTCCSQHQIFLLETNLFSWNFSYL